MKFIPIATRLLTFSLILILPSIASAASNSDIYVVTMDVNGNSNYMESYGDGTFSEQQFIGAPGDTGWSMASGIGDFDGDGDLDYLVAKGLSSGFVYLFERQGQGSNRSFKEPVAIAAWGDGFYPIGMAVADYNGDGILDFLLTYYYNTNGTLFLSIPPEDREVENELEFTTSLLEGIAPQFSNNADAGDFNDDGFADFVVAPAYGGEFIINIGRGDGTFLEPRSLTSYSEGNYWNVAVADFDNDGYADMIASNNTYIDFYEGQGDVADDIPQFIWRHRIQDDQMLDSAIDNFDFNDDGNQDLMVAKYGDDYSVAVLLGQGDGKTFTSDLENGIYGGGEGSIRYTIAAPTLIGAKNIPPVAAIEYEELSIIAGQPVTFDGLSSFDEDGEIVSYVWNFEGADLAATENFVLNNSAEYANEGVSAQHVFYDSGAHTVTLTVTDDQGATDSTQIQIMIDPLRVNLKFNPKTLNLKSKGKWIDATIILPKKKKACGVDMTGVFLADDDVFLGYAVEDHNYGFLGNFIRKHKKCRRTIKVRFDRQEVIKGLADQSGNVKLRVDGQMMIDGQPTDFTGNGKIRVIQPKPRKKLKWLSYFKKHESSKTCNKK